MNTVALLVGAATVMLLGILLMAIVMLREGNRRQRVEDRILMLHGKAPSHGLRIERDAFRVALMRFLGKVGQTILRTGMISSSALKDVENTLAMSGMRGSQGVGVFIGCKILLVCACPLIVWLTTRNMHLPAIFHPMLPPVGAILGLIAPDWLVGRWRQSYLERLEQALPDALDMMVICSQAGLALGPTIIRVGAELQHAYREIATEFELTANELQIMTDSKAALHNLGTRSGLDSFKRLATTLIQTIQYGTPVSEALRILSSEMRQEALTRFEERAARLPVMLTLPMIMFILPCTFLVVGGPAMIQVMKAFSH